MDKRELWEAYIAAMDAGDTAALRVLHTPDATLAHMTGHVASLDEWLDGMDAREFIYHRIEVRDVDFGGPGIVGRITTGITDDGSGHAWPLHVTIDVAEAADGLKVSGSRVSYDG